MSYTELKTINGDSIKGSGNLVVGGGGGVPYTGATGNVDLGEFGLDAGFIGFDTTPTSTPTSQGTLSWDTDHNTLQLVMNGTVGRVLEDTLYIAKNQTGVTIPKGTVVRANGTLGASGRILITPFLADGTYPSEYVMGVTAENILNGDDGMVVHFGQVKHYNTSAYTDGAILYASSTVAGGFTATPPVAPNNIVMVAIVIHAASNGIIQVRTTTASNIKNDEGVAVVSPSNGDVLTYNSSTGLWEDKAPVNPEGWSVLVKSANQDVTNSATLVNDTDLQFSVVAGGHYMVMMDIVISCNSAAGDYKSGFKVSAGTMKGSGIFTGTSNTAVAQNTAYNVNGTNATGTIASGTNAADLDLLASARIMFSFTASSNATFSYQFAQNSAIAATTARTWKGSILKYKRLD
jgi:hypothetical protein